MNTYAIVHVSTNQVINIIVWDGVTSLNLSSLYSVVPATPEHIQAFNERPEQQTIEIEE